MFNKLNVYHVLTKYFSKMQSVFQVGLCEEQVCMSSSKAKRSCAGLSQLLHGPRFQRWHAGDFPRVEPVNTGLRVRAF